MEYVRTQNESARAQHKICMLIDAHAHLARAHPLLKKAVASFLSPILIDMFVHSDIDQKVHRQFYYSMRARA
jgi:hypothetical protein